MKALLRPVTGVGQKTTLVIGLITTLAGCAPVGPDFVKPEIPVATEWAQQPDQGLQPLPDELIEQADEPMTMLPLGAAQSARVKTARSRPPT